VKHINPRKPTRRDLLRAAGGAAVLFPFLGGRGHAALPPTPRLVLLMQTNGTNQANFWPTATAPIAGAAAGDRLTSPILAPLAGDPTLAAAMTVVKGLVNDSGGSGNGHDQGFCGLYSGYRSQGTFFNPHGNGISIDQHLRRLLLPREPFPTLNCGVLASDTPPFKTHRRSFSYTAPRQQVPTEIDPHRLYANYFAAGPRPMPGVDPVVVAKQRLFRRQTVLDSVKGDLAALHARLPTAERRKLETHETALRELEKRLAATLVPNPDRPARCGGVTAPTMAGLNIRAEDDVPLLVPLMFDFIALALSCQLTRIVNFQFGNGGEKWYYRWLGIDENSHDDIAHRDHGTDPVITAKVLKINLWHAQQVAHLGRALAALPDGDGNLLDNTLVVWGNELATGPHGLLDIPVVLLGRAAGRLPAGGRLIDAGAQDYHRLGNSLLSVMGAPAAGFGEAPDCGPIVGLAG
jgi:hypothetical protein